MPDSSSGGSPRKAANPGPSSKGRKASQPSISDDALAALERHYGSSQKDAGSNDSDSASATGFAAMLAQGGFGGGTGAGSSGSMSALDGHDAAKRDNGEIPEAKIIAVRPDDSPSPTSNSSEELVHSAAAPNSDAPVVYATTPVEDVVDPALQSVNRPSTTSRSTPKRPAGMPEHYKTLIPILIAMGLVALAIGIWAIVQVTSGQNGSSSSVTRGSSLSHTFSEVAILGLPLGLTMLGLAGFIFKRYWNKK